MCKWQNDTQEVDKPKEYTCGICGSGFNLRTDLKNHQKSLTGELNWCKRKKICQYSTSGKTSTQEEERRSKRKRSDPTGIDDDDDGNENEKKKKIPKAENKMFRSN